MKNPLLPGVVIFTFFLAVGTGCSAKTDRVSAASAKTNAYSSMSAPELMESISKFESACSVATVNADGSPNIAVFVPGSAGEHHIVFGWQENATKANVLRTKKAMVVYDITDMSAQTKTGRHRGAVLQLQLEENKQTLAEIRKNNPALKETDIIMKIVKLMPIG